MKVLYFHQHFSTPKGGTGTRSFEFSKALLSHGHQVTIVCGSFDVGDTGLSGEFVNGRREGNVEGIKVIEYQLPYSNKQSLVKRAMQFVKFAISCCREVVKDKPDLVFCTSTPLTIAIPGIFSKLIFRKQFVFEVRDLWPELPVAMGVIKNPVLVGLMKMLEVISYKLSDKVIALSEGMRQGVMQHVPENKTVVITNGSDNHLAQIGKNVEFPSGIDEGDFVAVYSGTHGIANGLEVVVDSARALQEGVSNNIKILLIGDGMKKQELQEKASNYGLTNLIFVPSMSKVELFSLLQKCDVGLMVLQNVPAFYNGTSPNKFFDYLSVGLPVLCNYPGWIAKLIERENIGVSVAPDNAKEFADALISLSDSKEKLNTMSNNALNEAETNFDRQVLAEHFVSTLEKTVKE